MSTLAIVLVVLAVVVLALLIGGTVAMRRRLERDGDAYREHLAAADHALEAARASDRGWDRAVMEEAARAVVAERKPGWSYESLDLVLVDDRPGVVEDRAHFEASDGSERVLVVLRREAAGWTAEEVR